MQSSNSIYSLNYLILVCEWYHLRLWARNVAIVFFSEMSGADRVGECIERQELLQRFEQS
jgi:hypothetical protein